MCDVLRYAKKAAQRFNESKTKICYLENDSKKGVQRL